MPADQPRGRVTVAPPGFRNILGIGVMHIGPSRLERGRDALSVAEEAAEGRSVNARKAASENQRDRTSRCRQPPGAAGDRGQRLGILAGQQKSLDGRQQTRGGGASRSASTAR